ncbi:MAG: ABC transporter permease [Chryseobacterium sp.]|jgi:putative ABC transport system permease protein|uniref:ABC transporter permease n=1 Tax=Chryseobacterium sp. TaxID=1871047 RepID=UPI002834F4F5|nr:FtsX-like permease family protein [Chryseobacterium sp.]MDR2235347.1 ABC transporter permease [Chryseobacterium sp.]
MLQNWLKIAFISYRKNWLSTIINLLGLSVGLTIFLLVFLYWKHENSYEKWVPNKENVYIAEFQVDKNAYNTIIDYPFLYTAKSMFPEIENYTIANNWTDSKEKLVAEGKSTFTNPIFVTEDFFKVFQYKKLAGSYENIFVDDNSIAVSEDVAKQLFGEKYLSSIGKTIISDNNGARFVLQAIYRLPETEANTVFKPGFLIRQPFISENKDQWSNFSYFGFFRLKPNTDLQKLEEKLSKLQSDHEKIHAKKYGWNTTFETKVVLTNIQNIKLDAKGSGIDKGDKKSIRILLVLSALIMILSSINFINLNTAQASQRAKEVGVRKVMGGTSSNLIRQFLLETFLLYFTALFISGCLTELLLPACNQFLGKEIAVGGVETYFYLFLIVFIFSVISGIIPAVYLSNFKPIQTLKGNFARSKHGVWLRNGILTLQLIISSFFIISSLIIYTQVNYMMKKDLGFHGDQVFQINFNKTNYQEEDFNSRKFILQKEKIKRFPGVVDVTGSAQTMGNGVNSSSGVKDIKDSTKFTGAGIGAIDFNYFDFYQIKFISGRNINPELATDTAKSIVVNEALIKKMGWSKEDALGKELSSGMDSKHPKLEIIGVVNDFYYGGVKNEISPVVFFNYDRNWAKNQMTNLQIKMSGDNIPENLERIKKYWETEVEPGYPFDGNFVNKNFARTFEKFQKQQTLFTILNAVVLSVALLGLFALSSLLIEQKLKDVAIKKTLGANEKNIVWDLTKRFLLICIIAVLISIPFGYYAMNEWLKDFSYRIDMPVWPYVLSMILLFILTFMVVSFKAYRVTRINLVNYLKYE